MSEVTFDGEILVIDLCAQRKGGGSTRWVLRDPSLGTLSGQPCVSGRVFYTEKSYWANGQTMHIPVEQISSVIQFATVDAYLESICRCYGPDALKQKEQPSQGLQQGPAC